MGFKLGTVSRRNLVGVHPDLVKVVERAIALSAVDFRITCGVRTMAEQKRLKAAGASKTLKSRHIPETSKKRPDVSHAIDVAALVDGKIRWDWPLYDKISKAFAKAAAELGVPVEWGGDWKFRDGPHYQLPWRQYP